MSPIARSVSLCLLAGSADNLSILVVKRKYPPFAGELALPGGFLRQEESPEDGIRRKVFKETGISLETVSLHKMPRREDPQRDPRGPSEHSPFLGILSPQVPSPLRWMGETVAECCWVPLKTLSALAFDHGAIVCQALAMNWPFAIAPFALLNKGATLPKAFGSKSFDPGKKSIFFPGSFNPWHQGHRACVESCSEQNVLVLPDNNPWKNAEGKKCRWSNYRQIALELESLDIAVYPGLCSLEGANPTVNWLAPLAIKNKWLLLGYDSFLTLPQWTNASELMGSLSGLLVVPRDGNVANSEQVESMLKKWNATLQIKYLGEHAFQHLSSTQLRQEKGR